MTSPPVRLLNSITDLRPEDAGHGAISGSHGGLYPAALASNGGLRAVIFNDAGIGLERAGVGGVMALDRVGMVAAAVDCMTSEIGSAEDMMRSGRLSAVNESASRHGLSVGMRVADAARLLSTAPQPSGQLPSVHEARSTVQLPGRDLSIALCDSASLVGPDDAGGVVVTGSHGGLIGGDPARALKAAARVAVFNDAGGGKNKIGLSRLPALDMKGIAAVTVAHTSARIGDAASSLETGVISACNKAAEAGGARVGMPLTTWLRDL